MSDVKRFLAPVNDTCDLDSYQMVVLASDYAALEADLAELRAGGEPDEYPPCDYCGVVTDYHPWHGSGLINGRESPHIHACNECRQLLPSTPQPSAVPEGFALLPVEMTAELSQFLSAVMDAAGLVRHGRQSKELSEYLGSQCMKYRLAAAPSAPVTVHGVNQQLLEALENTATWIEQLPVPTVGAAGQLVKIDKAIAAARQEGKA